MIFKSVGDGRPYPDHGCTPSDWAAQAPRQVRLADLITVKRTLDLEALLDEQSTFSATSSRTSCDGTASCYLEDGLHRALRTALHGRAVLHARILDLDSPEGRARLAEVAGAAAPGGKRR